tara:strand:+ start:304 stop:3513 length:3210 start_codon:yes stop_codon:yes gene_type:complete
MKYKTTQKDRYGNMKSLEITMDNQLEVPPMTSAVPMYDHPGEPRGTDTVPAWLTPGEFVVNKEATDMYGPLIKKINDEGRKIQNMKPQYAKSGKEIDSMIESIMQAEEDKSGGSQFTNYEGDEPTQYGVTLSTYRELINSKATVEDLKKLTREKAKDIFKKDYYERYKIDKLPDYMQHNVLDMAINSGPGNAIKLLQKQIGTDIDNAIGPNTIKAAENYNMPEQFNNIYGSNRVSYYEDLVKNNKAKSKFLEGWKNRTIGLMDPENVTLPMSRPTMDAVGNPTNLQAKERIYLKDEDDVMEKYRKLGISPGDINQSRNPLSLSSIAEAAKQLFSREKFEMPKRSGTFDSFNNGGKVQHLDPGGMVYNTLDDKDDIMDVIFGNLKGKNNDGSIFNFNSIPIPEDDSTSMAMDMSLPKPYERKAFGMEDPNLMKAMEEVGTMRGVPSYDIQGVGGGTEMLRDIPAFEDPAEDNLIGGITQDDVPAILDPLGLDSDMYDQDTGMEMMPATLNIKSPDDVPFPEDTIKKPDLLDMDLGDVTNTNFSIAAINRRIADEVKFLNELQEGAAPKEAIEERRNRIIDLENKKKQLMTNQDLAKVQTQFQKEYDDQIKQQKLNSDIAKVEEKLKDPNITESEKSLAEESLNALKNQVVQPEMTSLEESQSKLAAAASNLNSAKEAELNQSLNSDAGKAATDNANQSTGTPAYEQAKGILNFLFGDLIDGQELGRGIAVYLASRALGYDHNDTIGYVAKNYLKRVDTKNALMDKFIKENAGKYTKKSLADYKRTGDPNVLTPIGSAPRPQGEEKTYYNAAGQARTAYKFKKKNAQGDDFIYYSWDKDGGDIKQRVSSAWTSDGSDVRGTDEYDEKINKAADRIVGQMKSYKEGKDKTKEKNIDKGIMQNVYKTDIEPEFAAREVAAWADKNGFQVYEMGPGIQQAWTMAIAAADEAEAQGIDVEISSLLPYLEEATIKQRLDNLKGVPPVSTAIVNGNKIEMNPSELVILNGKINNVTGDVNRFWNTVAKVYKGNDKDSGKPWRKIFEQHVIDSGENITPFALFGQVYLENIMEGMANQ